MGRAQVRTAVVAAIRAAGEAGTVPFLGTVYPARAYVTGSDYDKNAAGQYVGSSNGSSCVVIVNIASDKRQRRALVGRPNVDDTNIHQITLELYFNNVAGTPVVAQQEYDQVVDGLFYEIRHNPTMSAPTVVWSAGEYQAGVSHQQSAPEEGPDGTSLLIFGTVTFEAWEWDAGSA